MEITAKITNSYGEHHVTVATNGDSQTLDIPPKPSGYGSGANGGELLLLALATCYCNDIYREAAGRGIKVEQVQVEVNGHFGAEGEPANDITYTARIVADAAEAEIRALGQHTDTVAEIHNTLRVPTAVTLATIQAVTTQK
jgi:organic hydroperoxide reductase OsmC/OhrA